MTSAADRPSAADRLIVALDFPSSMEAVRFLEGMGGLVRRVKVGLELFTAEGPEAVKSCGGLGRGLFLDLKFHDIPNTVAGAARSAVRLGVWMFNVHASGGQEMMRRAVEAASEEAAARSLPKPLIIAVTVLTSMDQTALQEDAGVGRAPFDQVLFLAERARQAGLDGVVCSPQEARAVKARLGRDFITVTPGVRPVWSARSDQKRVATPAEALAAGADYLVIGRPITAAPDPVEAWNRTLAELREEFEIREE